MYKFSISEIKHLFRLKIRLKKCLHPDPKLQWGWLSLQWGIALIHINGLPAFLPLAFLILNTWWHYWRKITSDRLGQLFLCFCAWLPMICLWSSDPLNSLGGVANYIPFILLFLALRLVLQTVAQLRRLAWIMVTGSIFNSIIGLGQNFLNWSKQINFSVTDISLKAPDTIERMTATFTHANFFAGYLVMALIFGVVLLCEAWQQKSGNQKSGNQKSGNQEQTKQALSVAVLSTSILLNLVCIFYTSSRNGWLTLLLAALALMLFYGQRITIMFLGAIASIVMGAAFAGEPLQGWFRQIVPYAMWARINGQMYPEPYANSRVAIWEYAWNLARQKPWTGWGLQTFSQLYKAHAQIYLGHAHNLFLMLSAEVGIPTTLILIVLVGSIMFQAVRNFMQAPSSDRQILFGYLLAFSAFIAFNTVDVTVFDLRLNAIAWVLLGAIGGVNSRLIYSDRQKSQ